MAQINGLSSIWENLVSWVTHSPDAEEKASQEEKSKTPEIPNYYKDSIQQAQTPPSLFPNEESKPVKPTSKQEQLHALLKKMQGQYEEMMKMMDQAGKDCNVVVDHDKVLNLIYALGLEAIELQEQSSRQNFEEAQRELKAKEDLQQKRQNKDMKLLEQARSAQGWAKAETATYAMQTLATGAGAVAAGSVMSIAAFGVGLFMLAENLSNNFIKKQLAKVISSGDEESTRQWTERLQYLAVGASLATSFGAASGATQIPRNVDGLKNLLSEKVQIWLMSMGGLIRPVVTYRRGVLDHEKNKTEADVMTDIENIKKKDSSVGRMIREIDEAGKRNTDMYKLLGTISEREADTTASIFSR